jgi:cbb3-type cytochrome c oxidase subunit II
MSLNKPITVGYAASSGMDGWRGVALVAITYVYFLIFAQFAFLHRLAQFHITDAHLKAVMAAMALGGVLFSLITPRTEWAHFNPWARLRVAFLFCAAAALVTLFPLNLPASIATAFLIGASLGMLTVTLVTHLRLWIGSTNPLLKVGLGTGLGYLLCNFPPLFTASPEVQVLTAAILCLCAIAIATQATGKQVDTVIRGVVDANVISSPGKSRGSLAFPLVLMAFTALIWLDSAAFFIIQSTPALKSGTWQGTTHLYLNGVLHLLGALASVYVLHRRGLSTTLAAALLALGVACLLLLSPQRAFLASLFYPIGVSLYSVALVAYPALLSGATSSAERGRRAGWIYAIGGWFGSAMGIGMGQHLGHIPPAFVLAAAGVVLFPHLIKTRGRELAAAAAILLAAAAAWATQRSLSPAPRPLTQVERGRNVYIAEGCINCHSQYVRPNTSDVLLWGPVQTLAELRAQRPPLIGNRRQGPDLSEVAMRRSPLWLRAHFYAPSQISHGSIMPSFRNLFRAQRGDDLIAYLETLQPAAPAAAQHRDAELIWQPASAALNAATAAHGQILYIQECATCHDVEGATRLQWRISFHRLPTILKTGPYFDLSATATAAQRRAHLSQIIKFGIPNTDMAGHEYLSDGDVASLTLYVQQLIPQLSQPLTNAATIPNGDTR